MDDVHSAAVRYAPKWHNKQVRERPDYLSCLTYIIYRTRKI